LLATTQEISAHTSLCSALTKTQNAKRKMQNNNSKCKTNFKKCFEFYTVVFRFSFFALRLVCAERSEVWLGLGSFPLIDFETIEGINQFN
jgi:hypothetical protein